ncbi:4-(cytidine 5'-diphospho)-2-C-methyl-D-erythritol kinase [Mesorhizobium sp. CAU 1732]|uniref:4-(cytidine 5'-diphospho)-2-C-methyl-D-erythritol kinase n=1 Tax=Mesorhizobium sp. CAU 1732 TaxID=3140358 RepID=UPI003261CA04
MSSFAVTSDAFVAHAPAKVNLALHVTGRRDDGYHLLDTLVVFTEAGDTVTARLAERDTLTIQGRYAQGLATDSDNLVARARDLLRRLAGTRPTPAVALDLDKALPIASGIGGGSSDAAATLRVLCRVWRLDLDEEVLRREALALGADLPMCLAARPLIATGIGERLAPVVLPELHMVLANPGVGVSTPAIFKALQSRENSPLPPLRATSSMANLVGWLGSTRNDLEHPAMSIAPDIGDVVKTLTANGAALARMSGSGATCFGIFGSQDEAATAAAAIATARPTWYVEATRTIEREQIHGAD